jgi:hypothetical protein
MSMRNKKGLLVVLIAWTTVVGAYLVGTLIIGSRPHVQWGTTRELVSTEIWAWILGDLIIVGITFLLRRHRRSRANPEATR